MNRKAERTASAFILPPSSLMNDLHLFTDPVHGFKQAVQVFVVVRGQISCGRAQIS